MFCNKSLIQPPPLNIRPVIYMQYHTNIYRAFPNANAITPDCKEEDISEK